MAVDSGRGRRSEEDEYLAVMERCLTIEHDACIKGALHGLGHWRTNSSPRVPDIIDRFLLARTTLRPELISYANRARDGAVQ